MSVPMLVSCEWLKEKMSSSDLADSNIVVLDVSWASTRDCYEEYKKQHIPGARYFDVLSGEHTEMFPRNVHTAEQFTHLAQKAGINSDTQIIVYSNSDRAGYFISGRGWWTFRYFGHKHISILDGGLSKWVQLGNLTTEGTLTDIKPGNFIAVKDAKIYKSFDEIKQNTRDERFQIVDSRPAAAYTENHIPGSKNVDLATMIDHETGTLKSQQQLKQLFEESGVDLSRPIAMHCNSGLSSCAVTFAAECLGAANVSVFHGGFTEWKKRHEEK